MADEFYLGKTYDRATKQLGEPFRLKASDLTTHGIVIGMTGSGKTGLSIVMIEEAVRAGIPVIVIDPKGDMPNLALAFGGLAPAEFRPWIDEDEAKRDGDDPDATAAKLASTWTKGLAGWGLSTDDVSALANSREVRVLTPGSTAGLPLNILDSLEPPAAEVMADAEEFHDQVDGVVTALLGLVGIVANPIESREYILLATLVAKSWREGQALSLETLIGQITDPPVEKIGALAVDVVYPPADRARLMLSLNNLLASPGMASWRQGESIDFDGWLRSPDGRPRINIVYTAHLEEAQRIFVTALLLNKLVSWMRRQSGTDDLRMLLYMDEIFGYFPPSATPPTKKPLLTLLKQARAYGVGVLLSTQNPVDLDYRGLANMGFWAVGRLQTTQDQRRIRTGIEAALADSSLAEDFDDLLSGVDKRVFLIHDIHRRAPELLHTRWAMSYLRGPITREEIGRLPGAEKWALSTETASRVMTSVPPEKRSASPPRAPRPMEARFLNRAGGNVATPYLLVKAAVRYKIASVATDESLHCLAFPLQGSEMASELFATSPIEIDESSLSDQPTGDVAFGELPSYISSEGMKLVERAMRERIDDALAIELLYDPQTRTLGNPGESADALAERVGNVPATTTKRRSIETKLRGKRAVLDAKQQEVKQRGFEKWASLGTSILSNMSILTGRKRSVTGVGGVLSKQRMESSARARTQSLEQEIAGLEEELAQLTTMDTGRFQSRNVKPSKTDVSIIRYDLLWMS